MEKVKLTRVYRSDTDKAGNKLVSKKNGKPYTKCAIKCDKYGDRWLSGFGNFDNADWKDGDEVEIIVEESDKKDQNGMPYLDFKTPPKNVRRDEFDALSAIVKKLEQRLNALEVGVAVVGANGEDEGNPADNDEPLPF